MNDFDPEFDKLTDLPPTAPEVPHADLIARLRNMGNDGDDLPDLLIQAADALAALGDTVPREEYRLLGDQKAVWEYAARKFERERDALAHVLEQVRKLNVRSAGGYYVEQIRILLDSAPSVITAERNADIWDAGARAAGGYGHEDTWTHDMTPYSDNPYRNAAK